MLIASFLYTPSVTIEMARPSLGELRLCWEYIFILFGISYLNTHSGPLNRSHAATSARDERVTQRSPIYSKSPNQKITFASFSTVYMLMVLFFFFYLFYRRTLWLGSKSSMLAAEEK